MSSEKADQHKSIKTMVVTCGGSPEPILKSVQAYSPQLLVVIASHDTIPTAGESLKQAATMVDLQFEITDDPNSLLACYKKCADGLLRALGSSRPEEIMVDYTGGTKVMSAALLMAAARHKGLAFNYVGGTERDKNGVGVVRSGYEKMYTEMSPWALFAEEEKQHITILFNAGRFSSVIDLVEMTTQQNTNLPIKLEKYFFMIKEIAQGLKYWDQFNHAAALRYCQRGLDLLNEYVRLYPDTKIKTFLGELEDCLTRLQKIKEKTNEGKRLNAVLIDDLINNARRKIDAGQYDDAAARIYRALEMYGQLEFEKYAGCRTDSVPPAKIPERIRETFTTKYMDPKDKKLKLSMTATFEYLKENHQEVGRHFFEPEIYEKIKNIQNIRNHSILAHGIKPVSDKQINSILNTITDFIGELDYFEFPVLP
ncbi:MAG: TIGR02710 family CRISPR-associated CARF protein [Thermodesulfobacteriota bacterium]|nr:TIGR02710 family CRISPR-associated CARF protein [Thermodesulfobacteriota bacterium]